MTIYDQKSVLKDLKCLVCGVITPIRRRKSRNREIGHIKHMYCFKCMKITAHEEQM